MSALVVLAVLWGVIATSPAWANPAFWKHQVEGDFDAVVDRMKSGLETAQFVITQENNLAKGLEKNKSAFGGEAQWNTIGFARATTVHFCSLVFNHKVFNLNMDWSILCPFKVSAYSMRKTPNAVTLVLVKPTYLLAGDAHESAKEVGRNIEDRIINAIKDGMSF